MREHARPSTYLGRPSYTVHSVDARQGRTAAAAAAATHIGAVAVAVAVGIHRYIVVASVRPTANIIHVEDPSDSAYIHAAAHHGSFYALA